MLKILQSQGINEREASTSQSSERFIFVDALRGLAALMVLIDHLFFNNETSIIKQLPLIPPIPSLIMHGTLGVQIFFVLSGFVIAHSLRNLKINRHEVFNFMLRRQIRLDPPYWTIILIALILQRIESIVPGLNSAPLPDLREIALNATYLYEFFDVEPIIEVAWTLCLEVQFYLVFILVLAGVQNLRKHSNKSSFIQSAGFFVWISSLLSLAYAAFGLGGDSTGPFFFSYWFYFGGGVLSYWAFQRTIHTNFLWSFVFFLSVFIVAFFHTQPVDNIGVAGMTRVVSARPAMGLLIILLLYCVGCAGHLTDWLGARPLQFLGKISYSLYLVHVIVLGIVIRIGFKLTAENPIAATAWLMAAAAASIAVAFIFHLAIEKPSMRFASRLKIQREPISS